MLSTNATEETTVSLASLGQYLNFFVKYYLHTTMKVYTKHNLFLLCKTEIKNEGRIALELSNQGLKKGNWSMQLCCLHLSYDFDFKSSVYAIFLFCLKLHPIHSIACSHAHFITFYY